MFNIPHCSHTLVIGVFIMLMLGVCSDLVCWSKTWELLIELWHHKSPYASSHNTVSMEAKWSHASLFCPCCHFVLLYGLWPVDHKKELIKDWCFCQVVVSIAIETKAVVKVGVIKLSSPLLKKTHTVLRRSSWQLWTLRLAVLNHCLISWWYNKAMHAT